MPSTRAVRDFALPAPSERLVQNISSDRWAPFLNFWSKFILYPLGLCQCGPVVSILVFASWCSVSEIFIHKVPYFLSIHAALLHKWRYFPLFTPDRLQPSWSFHYLFSSPLLVGINFSYLWVVRTTKNISFSSLEITLWILQGLHLSF